MLQQRAITPPVSSGACLRGSGTHQPRSSRVASTVASVHHEKGVTMQRHREGKGTSSTARGSVTAVKGTAATPHVTAARSRQPRQN